MIAPMIAQARRFLARLRRAEDGVAMIEFAYSMVVIVPLFMGGMEVANYTLAKMRVSQIALHVADNASRIGLDSLLAKPQITETQINDLLVGANMQGGGLNLSANGRVIISSVEPVANPNTTDRYKIHWQRCYGGKTWPSSYGVAGATNLTAVGPAGKQVKAPAGGGVIFVEVAYTYRPLFVRSVISTNMTATAAMVVRDDRDYEGPLVSGVRVGIYNPDNVTKSSC